MVAIIKKVLPSSFKNKIKSINRARQLSAAMKRLSSAAENGTPGSDVLTELGRAWGDDGFRAVGGYLEDVARFAMQARGPVLEIGGGLTTLILGALVGRRGIPVWTLEHHPEFFGQTEATLKNLGLT